MTHAELVNRARIWLMGTRRCFHVSTESGTFQERADAIGWRAGVSTLVECKTSWTDFVRDFRKASRLEPANGLGQYRFFLVPPKVLKATDVPDPWGLLEAGHVVWVRKQATRVKAFNWEAEIVMLANYAGRLSWYARPPEFFPGKRPRPIDPTRRKSQSSQ